MILTIPKRSRTLTNNLCNLQVSLLIMESRNLYVTAARLGRLLITYHYNDLSQQYFIVCGITQPRNHTHANQTVQTALQHIRALGYE